MCDLEAILSVLVSGDQQRIQEANSVLDRAVLESNQALFEQLITSLQSDQPEGIKFLILTILKHYEGHFENKGCVIETVAPLFGNASQMVRNMASHCWYLYAKSIAIATSDWSVIQFLVTSLQTAPNIEVFESVVSCLEGFLEVIPEALAVAVIQLFCQILEASTDANQLNVIIRVLADNILALHCAVSQEVFCGITNHICNLTGNIEIQYSCYSYLAGFVKHFYELVCHFTPILIGSSIRDLSNTACDEKAMNMILMMWIKLGKREQRNQDSSLVVTTAAEALTQVLIKALAERCHSSAAGLEIEWDLEDVLVQCLKQVARAAFQIADPIILDAVQKGPPNVVLLLELLYVFIASADEMLLGSQFANIAQCIMQCTANPVQKVHFWISRCLERLVRNPCVELGFCQAFHAYSVQVMLNPATDIDTTRVLIKFYTRSIAKMHPFAQGDAIMQWITNFNQYPVEAAKHVFETVTDILIRPARFELSHYGASCVYVPLAKLDAKFCRNCLSFLLSVAGELIRTPVSSSFTEYVWYMLLHIVRDSTFLTEEEIMEIIRLAKGSVESSELPIPLFALTLSNLLFAMHQFPDKCMQILPVVVEVAQQNLGDDAEETLIDTVLAPISVPSAVELLSAEILSAIIMRVMELPNTGSYSYRLVLFTLSSMCLFDKCIPGEVLTCVVQRYIGILTNVDDLMADKQAAELIYSVIGFCTDVVKLGEIGFQATEALIDAIPAPLLVDEGLQTALVGVAIAMRQFSAERTGAFLAKRTDLARLLAEAQMKTMLFTRVECDTSICNK